MLRDCVVDLIKITTVKMSNRQHLSGQCATMQLIWEVTDKRHFIWFVNSRWFTCKNKVIFTFSKQGQKLFFFIANVVWHYKNYFLVAMYIFSCGTVLECLTRDWRATGSSLTDVTALCPWARHINPSLVLVQPRETRPDITQRLLTGT